MSHSVWLASLAGILSTAVLFGTDMFFLTVGGPALRLVAESPATEVMGFIHFFGDRRMPAWGILAMLSNLFLVLVSKGGHRGFYFVSLIVLILFVVVYGRFSKPINRLQTEAAKRGMLPDNPRTLQASWDRTLMIRVPLLTLSMVAQFVALVTTPSVAT